MRARGLRLCQALVLLGLCHVNSAGGDEDTPNVVTVGADGWVDFVADQKALGHHVILMFHVAWCKICKLAFPEYVLAADEVALKGYPVLFAHVDCTQDKSLCSLNDVHGYPTIRYLPNGVLEAARPYRGLRTKHAFTTFAERVSEPPVRSFPDWQELHKVLEKETFAAFVAAPPPGYTGFEALAARWVETHVSAAVPAGSLAQLLPKGLAVPKKAWLAAVSSPHQQWKGAGRKEASPGVAFYSGPAEESAVAEWIAGHRFPGVWALDSSNFFEVTHAARPACVLVNDPKNTSAVVEQELRGAAEAFAGQYFFGVIDGVAWSQELHVYAMRKKDLPRIVLFEANMSYYVEDIEELRAEHLQGDLEKVVAGAPLLRQDFTYLSGAFYTKREIHRIGKHLHHYSKQGRLQAVAVFLLALLSLAVGLVLIAFTYWWFKIIFETITLDHNPDWEREKGQRKQQKQA